MRAIKNKIEWCSDDDIEEQNTLGWRVIQVIECKDFEVEDGPSTILVGNIPVKLKRELQRKYLCLLEKNPIY